MKLFRKLNSLILTASLLLPCIMMPVQANAESNETPNTPLYLFRDTINSYTATETTTGSGMSNTLIDGVWGTSALLGGIGEYNTYGVFVEGYTQSNKVISLSPSIEADGEMCTLNLIKNIESTPDYVYSADMKTSSPVSGIRLADTADDTSYYELAVISDTNGRRVRFTKVTDATYPSSPDEWQYVDYSDSEITSSNIWLTLSLAKMNNTIYWSVKNKATDEIVCFDYYTDSAPLFSKMGRLQLFAYGEGKSIAPALFDNIEAKKLGTVLFEDPENNNVLKVEASWLNNSNTPPLMVMADYDTDGRLIDARTINNVISTQLYKGDIGYYIGTISDIAPGIEKRFFLWDSMTLQPISQPASYIVNESYEISADKYVYQEDRAAITRFSNGGGILFESLGIVNVSTDAELYVNGYHYTANAISDEVLDKFLGNAQGVIRLEKEIPGSLCYNKIYVDYYVIGIVNSVTYWNNTTTVSIETVIDAPSDASLNVSPLLTIELEDDAMSSGEADIYVEKNGSEIALNQLSENNVVAIAFNPEYATTVGSLYITNPEYMTVYATDSTIKGMVVDYDDEQRTYTIGESTHKYVGYIGGDLNIAVEYVLSLDPFNRIVKGEIVAAPPKYAILERYDANLDKVTLLFADGSTGSYEVHSNSNIRAWGSTTTIGDILIGTSTTNSISRPTTPVQNRVVSYRITNDTIKLDSSIPFDCSVTSQQYNPHTGKLGPIVITDSLYCINASDYIDAGEGMGRITDYSTFYVSDFDADTEYTAYAYKSGDTYTLIILTSVGTTFTADSRFAVIKKKPGAVMMDDQTVIGATALYKGEEITLYWDVQTPKHADNSVVAAGDAFFFTTDSDGFVDSSYKIYNKDKVNTISSLVTGLDDNGNPLSGSLWSSRDVNTSAWTFNTFADSTADIYLVEGIVTQVKSNAITFGVESSVTTINGTYTPAVDGNTYEDPAGATGMFTFGIADDCNAYEYDADPNYTGRDVERYQIVDASSINESDLTEYTYGPNQEEEEYVYNVTLDDPATTVNEQVSASINRAVALVVDGDVVCIYNIAE